MTFAMLLLLAAAPVQLEPTSLTYGAAQAPLEVLAPGAATVRVWCGACGSGALSATQAAGPGRFKVNFTLPRERYPRVVLLGVETRSEQGARQVSWVALKLLANASLKLETKPRASVTVSIGARRFGPMPADATGKLNVPVVVPPGFSSATVGAADRAGNITTTSVDLAPQPFPQAAVLAPVGIAADQRVELEVFAVEASGAPLADGARLRLSARRGILETPVPRAGGVFTVGYRAPKSLAGGPDEVNVAVDGSPSTALEVALLAAPAAKLALTLSPEAFTAGSGQRVTVTASATDVHGNVLTGLSPTFSTDFGTLEGALLTLPDAFGGRREVHVRAAAPGIEGEATLRLAAGPPVSAELRLPGQVAAGKAVVGTLSVKDAWGNPASASAVSVVGAGGQLAKVSAAPEGADLAVDYQTDQGAPVGPLALQVRSGERTLTRSELTVLPYQRDWALAAGAFVSGSWNLNQARALSPRLSFAVRLGSLPLEVGAEGAYAWFPRLAEARTVDGLNTVDLDMTAWSAALSVRASLYLAIRWSLQLCVAGGAQYTHSTFTAPGLTPVQASHWGPLVRGAGGVAFHGFGGRVLLQLEYGVAPLGDGNVRGNALGAGLALGYLATF